MSCWNYRLVRHDLPNQDGNVYIHEVNYDEDRNPEGCTQVSESPCANLSEDWYTDLNLQGGLEKMNWELNRLKDDINRNPEILKYSQFVPKRITNIHSMTLDNALYYANVILLGIYRDKDKSDIIWFNITDMNDLALRFHDEIWSMMSTPRDELHPDIDFTLEDEADCPDVLRIKASFDYFKGE